MVLRTLTTKDLEFMACHSVSNGIAGETPETLDYTYTLEDDGLVLVIGGLKIVNLYTAWCWFDMSEYGKKKPIAVYRCMKEWLDFTAFDLNLKRLQCAVEPDFEEAIRTVRHLGFEQESIMKNFFNDKDGLMFRRLF